MHPRDVLTRPAARPDAVLRYGHDPDHLLDVHLPPVPGGARAPVVVLVHGGFWQQAYDRRHTRPLAQALTSHGCAVVSPEYRRVGGGGGWPATFEDVGTALARVPALEQVVPERLDVDDVTLVGHSAGGHLALWSALRADGTGRSRVRRVVALAPVADLHAAHSRALGDGAVRALMGGTPDEAPDAYAAADPSPLLGNGTDVVVIHGSEDVQVPVEMSRGLAGVDYVELPGVEHFGLIDPLSPAWPHVRAAVTRRASPRGREALR